MGTVHTFHLIRARLAVNAGVTWQRRTLNGRPHLVGPATLIVPGVLAGNKGPLLYTAEDTKKAVRAWNHMPITLGHPRDEAGNYTSARRPEVLERYQLGVVLNARFTDKLLAEAWIDEGLARERAPAVLDAINAGLPVELSTGLGTDDEEAPAGSVWNAKGGRPRRYTHFARNHEPDHLAVLLDQKGACSLLDGCGLGVNHAGACDPLPAANAAVVNKGTCPECDGTPEEGTCECERKGDEFVEPHPSTDPTHNAGTLLERMWSKVVNAFLPNQPRSMVTGRIKKMGMGMGRGEHHEAAQRGFFMATMPITARHHELGVSAQEQAAAGSNPPGWAVDEALWEKAKAAADKADCDDYYACVAAIYENMGGEVREGGTENVGDPTDNYGEHDQSSHDPTGGGSEGGFSGPKGVADAYRRAASLSTAEVDRAVAVLDGMSKAEVHEASKEMGIPAPPRASRADAVKHVERLIRDRHGAAVRAKLIHRPTGNELTVNYIKEEDGKFCIYSESGKKLGEYDTREEAEERLKQIEYFKHKENQSPEADPEDDMKTRAEKIAFLVANCDCWKGKTAVLNDSKLFTDADIDRLVANVRSAEEATGVVAALKEKFGPELAVNAMPAFIKEKIAAKEEDEEEEEEEDTANNRTKEGKAKKTETVVNLSADQFDALLRQHVGVGAAELKSALSANETRRKSEAEIVANQLAKGVKDPTARAARVKQLVENNTLEQLYDRLADMKLIAGNADSDDELPRVRTFLGVGGGGLSVHGGTRPDPALSVNERGRQTWNGIELEVMDVDAIVVNDKDEDEGRPARGGAKTTA